MLASFSMAAKSGLSRWGASASGRVWPNSGRGAACGAWLGLAGHDGPGIGCVPNGLSFPRGGNFLGQRAWAGKHICLGRGGGLGRCDLALGVFTWSLSVDLGFLFLF